MKREGKRLKLGRPPAIFTGERGSTDLAVVLETNFDDPGADTLSVLARHRPSHRRQLRKLATDPASRSTAALLDAIIMPSNRRLDGPRSGVRLAADLARVLGRRGPRPTVVLLCSGAARSEHLPRDLFNGTRVLTIDLSTDYEPVWPRLHTDEHDLSTYHRRNDVGLKRNLGLVLARSQGWRHVLLLDDDVSRIRSEAHSETAYPRTEGGHFGTANLADALVALGEQRSRGAGWVLEDLADNSVVCHARRLVGLEQDKFVGGGALLLRCDEDLPFFPATYNEDWLFLLPLMLGDSDRRKAVIEGGLVGQDEYPVYVEKRAASEELGDVLGEGLFNLLTLPEKYFRQFATSYDYWRAVVTERTDMIKEVMSRLDLVRARGERPDVIESVGRALTASLAVHDAEDWSFNLALYSRRWLQDLDVWKAWFPTVDRSTTPEMLGFVEAEPG